MSKGKILYVISNPFYYKKNPVGGSISSGAGVIKALAKKGYKVEIVSDDEVPTVKADQSIKYTAYSNKKIRLIINSLISILPNSIGLRIEKFFFSRTLKKDLSNALRKNNYDFVYFRASPFGHIISKIVRNNDKRLIIEVNKPLSMQKFNNGNEEIIFPAQGQQVKKNKSEINQYEDATMISIDSSLRAKWIHDFVDCKFKSKMFVIHNGVDENLFKPSSKKEVNKNPVIVGMASSFRWYNDLEELLQIASKTISRNPEIYFKLFIGDISKRNFVKEMVSDKNLCENIELKFQLNLKDMPKELNSCDILISPFNFKGKWPHICSIKHLEYLSVAKPVVATNAGEVNFAIKDNHNGFLISEGDIEDFVNKIVTLSKSKTLRESLGNQGRKDVINFHTWEHHVNKLIENLENLNETSKQSKK
jgi:glycosyltransferase involved in cell wall biosynthesis